MAAWTLPGMNSNRLALGKNSPPVRGCRPTYFLSSFIRLARSKLSGSDRKSSDTTGYGRLAGILVLSWFLCSITVPALGDDGPQRGERLGATTAERSGENWVEKTLRALSLEDKVGQLIQARYYADYADLSDPGFIQLRRFLTQFHIGSVAFYIHRDSKGPVRIVSSEAAKMSNRLQQMSPLPLLIAADLERGLSSRLNDAPAFPWPMAFAAANKSEDVEKFASVTATQARAVGIHWIFAPIADVNDNPVNPVINTRSYGDDPATVAGLVGAFIRGAHKNEVIDYRETFSR